MRWPNPLKLSFFAMLACSGVTLVQSLAPIRPTVGPWLDLAANLFQLLALVIFYLTYEQVVSVLRSVDSSTQVEKIEGRSYIVDYLLPPDIAQDVQANMEEVMPIWIAAHGPQRANRIRRAQVFRIVVGHYATPIVAFSERVLAIVRGA
ncbi:hypothetical protein HZF05_14605 [Sphingomonas sp. CGMCC 1.13654]|uniref:Uncharacterized protein n=1 Tax=Sphingomonas chungangi TaxID=2683589 RepID=A0A838LAZ6_9SPHN|nr:hypothetical protein [Sphingomonas chungangi]MBA2935316.1 hypothetical protein [Sphingomonas chungangi]MVW56823.1 hypothetical protein [Sphingomonas chungangi]